jgi:hypothetical protein
MKTHKHVHYSRIIYFCKGSLFIYKKKGVKQMQFTLGDFLAVLLLSLLLLLAPVLGIPQDPLQTALCDIAGCGAPA